MKRATLALTACLTLPSCSAPPQEPVAEAEPERGPGTQPGTAMELYAPEQHEPYDGRFIVEGSKIYQVGTLDDESPWDHIGNDGSRLREVGGAALIDVDEINNTGTFRAELELPEGKCGIDLEEFKEFSPCQDGGIAAYLIEHGDSWMRRRQLAQEPAVRGRLGPQLGHPQRRAVV